MTLRRSTLMKYRNPVFVETGTHRGDGVALALKAGFQRVISFEINEKHYRRAVRRFRNSQGVTLYYGDTVKLLPATTSELGDDTTFWLDAHPYGAKSQTGVVRCPILEELRIIKEAGLVPTILIDDMRLFRRGAGAWGNIRVPQIREAVLAVCPDYKIKFERGFTARDILAVRPPE